MPEVVIYRADKKPRRKFFLLSVLAKLANGLVFLAILGLTFTYGPLLKAEVNYQVRKKLTRFSHRIGFGDLIKMAVPISLMAPDPGFSLVIPKISAQSRIIANVDANNPKDYLPALKKGVAHAAGSVFPGMKGTTFLFAHSAAAPWAIIHYNAVFYLLNELEVGDQIVVFFNNKRFNYRVTEKQILSRGQTEVFSQKEKEILVLQTCWPPGTTQKALLILAKP